MEEFNFKCINTQNLWHDFKADIKNLSIEEGELRLSSTHVYESEKRVIDNTGLDMSDIAVDECDTIYIINKKTNAIFISEAGSDTIKELKILPVALESPSGIGIDLDTIYIADKHRLIALARSNLQIRWMLSEGYDGAPFNELIDLTVAGGIIYAMERCMEKEEGIEKRILMVNRAGNVISQPISMGVQSEPTDIAVDKDGDIYVLDTFNGKGVVKIFRKRFLFSWGNVPGNDNDKFLGFLRDYFNIDWVNNAEITKTDEKTLRIFTKENFIEILLEEYKKRAILKISDGRAYNLQVNEENCKLNIYKTETTPETIHIGFSPKGLAVDVNKQIFVGEPADNAAKENTIYKVSRTDAPIPLWSYVGTTVRLITDSKSNLFILDDAGKILTFLKYKKINLLNPDGLYSGYYISKPINSGDTKTRWHRFLLEGKFEEGTQVEFSYYVSNNHDEYLFSWDDIPGNDNRKLIEILIQKFGIDWVKTAKIEKIDDGRAVKVSAGNNYLSLKLGDGKTEVNLKTDDGRTDKFIVKMENGKLSIYDESIKRLQENEWHKGLPGASSIQGKERRDALFQEDIEGQYLWFKITLTGSEALSPALKSLTVFFPRMSYLDYLPAVYQEDPVSKEFLERFLSIFESIFYEIDFKIEHLSRFFDAYGTPLEFISWLGSWLSISEDENFPEEMKRLYIHSAISLYKKRGTREGLEESIALFLYTKKYPDKSFEDIAAHYKQEKPFIVENFNIIRIPQDKNCEEYLEIKDLYFPPYDAKTTIKKPYTFNWNETPGYDSDKLKQYLKNKFSVNWIDFAEIQKKDVNGPIEVSYKDKYIYLSIEPGKPEVRLISDEGKTYRCAGELENGRLRIYEEEEARLSDVLFGKEPFCFCVFLGDANLSEDTLNTVKRIIDEQKPAHTCYGLKVLEPWFYLDMHTYLGINTSLTYPATTLGRISVIGRDTVLYDTEHAGQVRVHSRVGVDTKLT
ncbi:MAG: phage tail protein [Candidatus Methanoperedens sp.]|nr:phage tail protein [Candidatus Methanoperedens sp.]